LGEFNLGLEFTMP